MKGFLNKKGTETEGTKQPAPNGGVTRSKLQTKFLPLIGSISSGILLALCFPAFGYSSFVFIGLVPLMFAVQSVSGKRAARLGLLSGFVFFVISLSWLSNLTGMVSGTALKASVLLGYGILALYCGLYFIPMAVTVSVCVKRWGVNSLRTNLRMLFAVTTVWVGSEYLRGILFTGFPWNPLGVSQYTSPVLIQVAEFGGVSIVTACIVWMNTALFITLRQYTHGLRLKKYGAHIELMIGMVPIALSAAFGLSTLINRPQLWDPIRVVLVQPNIAQSEKWDAEKDYEIYRRLEELSEVASRLDGIDLMIWPETALPDFVHTSRTSYMLVKRITKLGVPLLVGSMDVVSSEGGNVYYNSSMLYNTNGIEVAKYDKQHLVPFGEYVPFPKLTSRFTPVDVDFRGGTKSTLFPLRGKASFSTLICFEDTVAPLAVKAVRNGARWLVNQTNDAWFDPTAESEQHLAHAVFRCIENRTPMARCGNTGVTCTIDAYGDVTRDLDPRVEGFTVGEVYPRPIGHEKTLYTRKGDAFAKCCLLAGTVVLVLLVFSGRKSLSKEEK